MKVVNNKRMSLPPVSPPISKSFNMPTVSNCLTLCNRLTCIILSAHVPEDGSLQ